MPEISFDNIEYQTSFDDVFVSRHGTEGKGGSPLATIAGVAVSIAVPFVAPAVAGALFGSTIMAGTWGALAAAGTGAVLGAAGAALTGNDPLLGALTGGLGAGAVQGLGAFGAVSPTSAGVFGGTPSELGMIGGFFQPAAAVPSTLVGAGTTATGAPIAAATQAAMQSTAGTALAGAAPAAAGLDLGAALSNPMVQAGLINAAPSAIGTAVSELMPASEEALAREAALGEQFAQEQEDYARAVAVARNLDPDWYAQNAANAARLQVAANAAEGTRAAGTGLMDPARLAAERRRAAVAGQVAGGSAYAQEYLTRMQEQKAAEQSARASRPNAAAYYDDLGKYGVAAEKAAIAKAISEPFAAFGQGFLPVWREQNNPENA